MEATTRSRCPGLGTGLARARHVAVGPDAPIRPPGRHDANDRWAETRRVLPIAPRDLRAESSDRAAPALERGVHRLTSGVAGVGRILARMRSLSG